MNSPVAWFSLMPGTSVNTDAGGPTRPYRMSFAHPQPDVWTAEAVRRSGRPPLDWASLVLTTNPPDPPWSEITLAVSGRSGPGSFQGHLELTRRS
ncbi:MAG: hypothetical protein ACYDB7_14585 [Mycobacteriales bacterium]